MPNIIEIIDFSSPHLDVFARLTEPQLRKHITGLASGIIGSTNHLRELGFKTVAMVLHDTAVSIDNPQLMVEEKLAIILVVYRKKREKN